MAAATLSGGEGAFELVQRDEDVRQRLATLSSTSSVNSSVVASPPRSGVRWLVVARTEANASKVCARASRWPPSSNSTSNQRRAVTMNDDNGGQNLMIERTLEAP
jgi:hypothetical protein